MRSDDDALVQRLPFVQRARHIAGQVRVGLLPQKFFDARHIPALLLPAIHRRARELIFDGALGAESLRKAIECDQRRIVDGIERDDVQVGLHDHAAAFGANLRLRAKTQQPRAQRRQAKGRRLARSLTRPSQIDQPLPVQRAADQAANEGRFHRLPALLRVVNAGKDPADAHCNRCTDAAACSRNMPIDW